MARDFRLAEVASDARSPVAGQPFEREFPSMAKTMAANTRLAEAQRKENHARSRICQISF